MVAMQVLKYCRMSKLYQLLVSLLRPSFCVDKSLLAVVQDLYGGNLNQPLLEIARNVYGQMNV